MKTDVVIVPCPDYSPESCRTALTAALEPLGGLTWVRPGMRIAIKANLLAVMKPETAAVTHPALVCELCAMLAERGASVVVGDSPGGLYNAKYLRLIYQATGMTAVRDFGGELNEDFRETDVDFPQAVCAKSFRCTQYLLEADAVIDFCKLKTHGLMAYTGACKNFFGAVPGTRKPEYHYLYPDHKRFANMLIDLCEYIKPRLCIADAVEGMEGNGPTAGTPRFIGAVLASENPHALDMCGAHLMGLEPREVPTLEEAIGRGLIPETLEELNVAGALESFVLADFKLIPKCDVTLWGVKHKQVAKVLRLLFDTKPAPDGGCTGCGKCAKLCPAHAIDIRRSRARIDRSACIRCYCCQEFCPTGSMRVTRTPLARLLDK